MGKYMQITLACLKYSRNILYLLANVNFCTIELSNPKSTSKCFFVLIMVERLQWVKV